MDPSSSAESSGVCPNCGGSVVEHWRACPLCGADLPVVDTGGEVCVTCGKALHPSWIICPQCKTSREMGKERDPDIDADMAGFVETPTFAADGWPDDPSDPLSALSSDDLAPFEFVPTEEPGGDSSESADEYDLLDDVNELLGQFDQNLPARIGEHDLEGGVATILSPTLEPAADHQVYGLEGLSMKELLQRAHQEYGEGRLVEALSVLQTAESREPRDVQILVAMGQVLFKMQRTSEGQTQLRKAVGSSMGDLKLMRLVAGAMEVNGLDQDLIRVLREIGKQVMEESPKDKKAMIQLQESESRALVRIATPVLETDPGAVVRMLTPYQSWTHLELRLVMARALERTGELDQVTTWLAPVRKKVRSGHALYEDLQALETRIETGRL